MRYVHNFEIRYNQKTAHKQGISITLLYVVVGIICMLLALYIYTSAGNTITDQSGQIISELNTLDSVMKELHGSYPSEQKIAITANPSFADMKEVGQLDGVLQKIRTYDLTKYFYDNDEDRNTSHLDCDSVDNGRGVNIFVSYDSYRFANKVLEHIDERVDQSDGLLCGKVREFNGYLMYLLSSE